MYSALLIGGGIVGGTRGVMAQHSAAQHDKYARKPEAYARNAINYGVQGTVIGSGIYGLGKAAKNSSRIASVMAGVGAGIGVVKGIKDQQYALKHYNSPEYGPGVVDNRPSAFIIQGLKSGVKYSMFGLGAYGALDVASSLLRKKL